MAKETGLPILPVLIEGIERLTLREFISCKRKITVTFGQPLYANDIFQNASHPIIDDAKNDYEGAAALLMKKIAQLA